MPFLYQYSLYYAQACNELAGSHLAT